MSSIQFQSNASGTGVSTLLSPNTNTNYTITLPTESGTALTSVSPGFNGFKNRIINGAMMIDQRNAGASVTPNGTYTLDRFAAQLSQSSKYTVQQNAGSVTPPTGFSNYLGVTSSSAYSITSSDFFFIQQHIEGFNTADLAFGTASASTVTLSFWVRSSLTGTFGGSLRNSAANRSYPFSYTISSANTWEQKSITIAGDTSGTWIGATNGIGINVSFSLGMGSTYSTTAGAWATGNYASVTSATSVVGTNGATFYITGVQLEKGSTATSFDYRPYGTELALCQRYYQKFSSFMNAFNNASYNYYPVVVLKVTMRATPTLDSGASFAVSSGSAGTPAIYSGTGATNSPDAIGIYNSAGNWTTNVNVTLTAGFNSEL
jgi:hypothetical protein